MEKRLWEGDISYSEAMDQGIITETKGSARVGRGTKRHRAYQAVNVETGKKGSPKSYCPAAGSRSRMPPWVHSFMEDDNITCGHCNGGNNY
jgi:hypothetical protein